MLSLLILIGVVSVAGTSLDRIGSRTIRQAKLIAIGNWANNFQTERIAQLNHIIREAEHTGFPLQTVFLLGGNYADGESLSDLFTNFLGKNISTIFTPIDYGLSRSSINDQRWFMAQESVSLVRFLSTTVLNLATGEEEEDFDSLGCFWAIDSTTILESINPKKYIEALRELIELWSSGCHWKAIMSTHPIVSGGIYKNDKKTKILRALLIPILDEFRIDFFISGHEHSSQVIELKLSSHKLTALIAGASVVSYPGSVGGLAGVRNANMLWANDADSGVVLKLQYDAGSFSYQFVNNSTVLYHGMKSKLAVVEEGWPLQAF